MDSAVSASAMGVAVSGCACAATRMKANSSHEVKPSAGTTVLAARRRQPPLTVRPAAPVRVDQSFVPATSLLAPIQGIIARSLSPTGSRG